MSRRRTRSRSGWQGLRHIRIACRNVSYAEYGQEILATGVLHRGDAKKLSGALTWASQQSFKRLGRAMIAKFALHVAGLRLPIACILAEVLQP